MPVREHLAPCLGRKLLAANVTGFTLMTTKADDRAKFTFQRQMIEFDADSHRGKLALDHSQERNYSTEIPRR